ncbi:phytanoyl-CoA dioxygenase family protein [Alteromonas facilis]|uniref:phytanoyl-CoA dioxygenase family protein n=1 Tax=Alteromonas facilis TaxID=2048004 RepID=UPI000C28190B|nr:phytanoyl-CoA dioxygenase family protein [Alteromonas facilis]
MLTPEQKNNYKQHGYVVLHDFFDQTEMDVLKAEAMRIVDEFDPNSTRSIFSSSSADTDRDTYLLHSGDKVRCFFEQDAFDDRGNLQQQKHLSINKIGHALHNLSPVFKTFSQQSKIAQVAKDVGVKEPEIRQSMYIFKQPRIGGQIRWHQDATYFKTDPISVVTFWLAIEPATIENGCLQVDRRGDDFALKEQFVRYDEERTGLLTLHDEPWPDVDQALPLEVDAGTLIVFSGTLPHFSAANYSAKSRHAFTLHITSADTQYDALNWLQTPSTRIG